MSAIQTAEPVPAARVTVSGIATTLAVMVIIVAACVLHIDWMLQNHDADWLLVAARRMLAGGRYLRDFNEVTPPLILPLMAPPAGLAALLGRPAYPFFVVYVGLLIALSVVLIRPTVRDLLAGNPLGCHFALIAYAAILAFEPGYEFGQREHIFLILFFPGLLWYAAREAGGPERPGVTDWVALVLAAASVLIKPYFLLILLVLLLIRAERVRHWRVLIDLPVLVFAAAVLLYGAMVLLVFPEYLAEANLQRQIYFGWNRWWVTVLDSGRDTIAALSLAVAVACLLPAPPRVTGALRLLCVASACCVLVAIGQEKGWPYHYLPALEIAAFVLVFAVCTLLPLPRSSPSRAVLPYRLAAPLIAIIAVQAMFLALRPLQEAITFQQWRFAGLPLIRALHDKAAGRSVMLLTSGLQFGYPSLAGVKVGASHPGQPMLAGVVKLEHGDAAERALAVPLRKTGIDMAAESIDRYKPDWIAVDVRAQKQSLPDNFDILAYYLTEPAFRAAWSNYTLNDRVEGWDLYTREPGK